MKFSKTREMHKPLLKVQILIPTRISFRELHSFLLLLFFFFTTVNAKETAKTNATFSLTIYSSKQSKAKKWQKTKPNPPLLSLPTVHASDTPTWQSCQWVPSPTASGYGYIPMALSPISPLSLVSLFLPLNKY